MARAVVESPSCLVLVEIEKSKLAIWKYVANEAKTRKRLMMLINPYANNVIKWWQWQRSRVAQQTWGSILKTDVPGFMSNVEKSVKRNAEVLNSYHICYRVAISITPKRSVCVSHIYYYR